MTILKICLSAICMIFMTQYGSAQTGQVVINEDQKIKALIDLKKEIGETNTDRYKIQIYSGKRASAEGALEKFKETFANTNSKLVYETPNYKVWVGSYRSRLEADRALLKLKGLFPSSFIFKPKK